MVFLLSTVLISGLVIFVVASLLEWISKKAVPNLSPVVRAVATVTVATAIYMYVMTRPAIVGPYEQFTFENIGGQLLAGVLVAGYKVWAGRKAVAGGKAGTGA